MKQTYNNTYPSEERVLPYVHCMVAVHRLDEAEVRMLADEGQMVLHKPASGKSLPVLDEEVK